MPSQTKWYQKAWAKVTGAVIVLGMLGTIGRATVEIVNHWNFYQELPTRLDNIEDSIKSLKQGDEVFVDYFDKKSQTFAVGFRVKKTVDEHTGRVRFVKQYRDWKGYLNDIILDKELTEYYGIEYYFYFDKDTQEKIYCW